MISARIRVSLLLALACGAGAAAASEAAAQSLWQRGRARHVSLIADNRAMRVGDIVTILVEERQRAENDETVKLEKSTVTKAEFPQAPSEMEFMTKYFPIEWSSDRTLDAKNEFEKEGNFVTRITGVVLDVQPNGNLVVEGRRKVLIESEEKWMTVTGLVRAFDVRFDNTVPSSLVANATVTYQSCGPLARNSKRGWFEAIVDFIWPF